VKFSDLGCEEKVEEWTKMGIMWRLLIVHHRKIIVGTHQNKVEKQPRT
jgi:hypothetical protein